MRMPCERTNRVMSRSAACRVSALAGVVSGDDHDRAHSRLGAVADDIRERRGRDRDDREVHRLRQVLHAGDRGPAGDVGRGRVHRVHRPGESVRDQVDENLVPDRPWLPVGPDHRDRPRREQLFQRPARRAVLAAADPGQRARPPVDAQHHVLQVAFRGDRGGVSGGREHVQHRRVGGEHVGLEHVDADRGSRRGEPVKQQPAQPHALELVGDRERHLGVVGVLEPDQQADSDHLVVEERHEGEMVRIVDVHELAQQFALEPRHRSQQPLRQRVAREPAAEVQHGLFVGGPHRPDEHRAPVPQQPGLFQLRGVPHPHASRDYRGRTWRPQRR